MTKMRSLIILGSANGSIDRLMIGLDRAYREFIASQEKPSLGIMDFCYAAMSSLIKVANTNTTQQAAIRTLQDYIADQLPEADHGQTQPLEFTPELLQAANANHSWG